MSYNGSGTFSINTAGQPVITGTVISSTAFNALTADLATGLSTAITKDGQTTTTSRILFAQGISSTLTTDATSATTGSIITAGGISMQKALWVGTTATIAGATTMAGITATSLALGGATLGSNALAVTGTTALSGLLTAAGGVSSTLTTDATSTTTGSIITAGGISTQKALFVGTTSNFAGAMTYGGVTLSNAVTGTGNMVLSTSPSLSGILTVNGTTARSEFSVTAANTEAARFRSTSGSNAYGLSVAFDTVPNDTTRYFISCNSTGGTTYAIIYSNGNLANLNNSYGSTSDAKLKQDIVLAGSQWGDIKEIGKIVSKYRFKSNPNGPLQIGLVAQDVQAISPGLVNSSSDVDEETKQPLGTETLSVQYSVLYMKAVKALGEALERIETLESRVATLEGNQP
jgi:hypothetical protein